MHESGGTTGVMSGTNDISEKIEGNIKCSIYADDVAVWCTGRDRAGMAETLQRATNELVEWANKWKLRLNAGKSEVGVFSTDYKDYSWRPEIHMMDTIIPVVENPKLLGVTYDKGLTFSKQTEIVTKRMKERISVLKRLAGTKWGCDPVDMRNVYKALIESVLQYAAPG